MLPIVPIINLTTAFVLIYIARHLYLSWKKGGGEAVGSFFKFSLTLVGFFFFIAAPLFVSGGQVIIWAHIGTTFFLFLSLGYFSSVPLSLTGRYAAADFIFFLSVATGIIIATMRLTIPPVVETVVLGNFVFYHVFKEGWEYLSQGVAASIVAIAGVYFFLSSSNLMENPYLKSRFLILAVVLLLLFLSVVGYYILTVFVPEYIGQIIAGITSFTAAVLLAAMLYFERKHSL